MQTGIITSCTLFYLNYIIYMKEFPLYLVILHNIQCTLSFFMWLTRNRTILWCDRVTSVIYMSLCFQYLYNTEVARFEVLQFYLSNTLLFKLIDYEMISNFNYKQTTIWYVLWHYNLLINNILVIMGYIDEIHITEFVKQHIYCTFFELLFHDSKFYNILCKLTFIILVFTNPYINQSIQNYYIM